MAIFISFFQLICVSPPIALIKTT